MHLAGAQRAPPDAVLAQGPAGLQRAAAGQPGDDRGDLRRLALELELAEVGEVGDADRVAAGGGLAGAVARDHPPPGALGEAGAGAAVHPLDRAARRWPLAAVGERRIGSEELEAHPRSRS